MRSGSSRVVAALAVLLAVSAAWAGKISVTYNSGVQNDHLFCHAFRYVVDGYPPVPREEIIMGEDMAYVGNPNFPTLYKAVIEASQLYPGGVFGFKVRRYTDFDNLVIGDQVLYQGQAQAY